MKTSLFSLLLAFSFVCPARAANLDWAGTSSGDWSPPINWLGGVSAPSGGDDLLTFPVASPNTTMNQNFASGTDYWYFRFNGSGYVLDGNSFDFDEIGFAQPPEIEVNHGAGTTTIIAPFTVPVPNNEPMKITVANVAATLDINGVMSGNGEVTITGNGLVRFDAAMTYPGVTLVDGDVDADDTHPNLLVSGSTAGPMTLQEDATLHGSGTIGDNPADDLTVKGTISPGDPAGDVTSDILVNGDLHFSTALTDDGAAIFDLQGTGAGSSYDQIDVAGGAVTTNGAAITLRPDRGFAIGTIFVLINKTSPGDINNSTPFSGIGEGSVRAFGLNSFQFSYAGGDGNDFTATVVASTSSGTTREWDAGGATQDWSEAANWTSNTLPLASDTLVFGSLAPAAPLTERFPVNDLGGNPFALNFTAGGYDLSSPVAGGNDLTLSDGIEASHLSGTNNIDNDLVLAASQAFALTGAGNLDFDLINLQLNGQTLTASNASSGTLRFNSTISGGGASSFTKSGSGLVLFGSTTVNTYAGNTLVNQGELRLSRSSANGSIPGDLTVGSGTNTASVTTTVTEQIANDAVVTVKTFAAFLPGAAETIGGLVLDGGAVNSGANILAVDGNITANQTTTITSPIRVDNATRDWTVASGRTLTTSGALSYSPLSSGNSVNKKGTGILVIAGTSQVTTFSLDQGVLQLDNNSATDTIGVSLNGGTLNGSGRAIRISAVAGGTLSPATGTATAIMENTRLSLNAATTLEFDLNGTTAGTGHDQLDTAASAADSSGAVILGNAALVLRDTSVFAAGTPFKLVNNDLTDAVTGTFNGLAEGATVRTTFNQFAISYTGGTGNDVVLTVVAPAASGVTRTWDGDGGANTFWTTAANWTGDVAPQPGDNLVFPSNVHISSENDYPVDFSFDSITFNGTASNFDVRNITGSRVRLFGSLTSNVSGLASEVVRISLPVIFVNDATITNLGPRRLEITTTITATTSLISLRGDNTATRREILFTGSGILTGATAAVQIQENPLVDFGTQAHTYGGTTIVVFGRLTGSVTNALRTNLTVGTAASVAEASLSGSLTAMPGTVTVNALGTCTITSGSLLCQSITVSGGAFNAPSRPITTTGNVTLNSGTLSNGPLNANTLTVVSGTFSPSNTQTLATLNANGGTFAFAGGANYAISGTATVATAVSAGSFSAATLTHTGALTSLSLTLTTLNLNSGTLTVSGPVNIAGIATVAAASTFNAVSFTAASLNLDSNNCTVSNTATITGVANLNGELDCGTFNAGTLELDSGSLAVTGTATITGTATVGTATIATASAFIADTLTLKGTLNSNSLALTTLNLNSGTATVTSGALITGTATFAGNLDCATFSAATLNLNSGTLDATGSATITGTATVAAALTCATFDADTLALNNGTVEATGAATINDSLTVDGTDTFSCGSLVADGFTRSGGTFSVTSNVQLSGDLEVTTGTLNIPGRLSFTDQPDDVHNTTVSPGASVTTAGLGGVDAANPVGIVHQGGGALTVSANLSFIVELGVESGTFRSNAPDGGGIVNTTITGGILAGSGTFGPVSLLNRTGSRIAPGASPGILTMTSFLAGSATPPNQPPNLDFEITGSGVPGTFHDQIRVNGPVDFSAVQTLVHITLASGFVPLTGTEYILIDKTTAGPITGSLFNSGGIINENTQFDMGSGITLEFSYAGGDGNDFTATVVGSPAGEFRVWDGGGTDANWMTAANWEDDIAAQPTEALHFPNGAAQTTNHNNFPADTSFNGLKIADNYTFSGNRVALTNDVDVQAPGAVTLGIPLRLDESRAIILSGGGSLTRSGVTDLANAATLILRNNSSGEINVTGRIQKLTAITSDGGVIADGTGLVKLNVPDGVGIFGNGYIGETWVQRGVLQLTGVSATEVPGNLRIGGAGFSASVENPASATDGHIANTADLIMEAGGTHIMTGDAPTERIRNLIMRGGSLVHPGSGFIVLDSIRAEGAVASTITPKVSIEAGFAGLIHLIHVEADSSLTFATHSIFFGGPISPSVRKTGGGPVFLRGQLRAAEVDCREGMIVVAPPGSIEPPVLLNGGTLAGSGGIDTITGGPGGSTLAPSGPAGTGIGTINNGNLILAAQTRLSIEIGGTSTDPAEFDRISLNGNLNLNGCTLDLTLANGFSPTAGQTFRIIDKGGGGPTPNPFAGLPEGASFSAAGQLWSITYVGGGNDVVLTAQGPTPASDFTSFDFGPPTGGGGGVQITASITGPAGTLVNLEASDDLQTWIVIASATTSSLGVASFNVTDAAATGSHRFYQVVIP